MSNLDLLNLLRDFVCFFMCDYTSSSISEKNWWKFENFQIIIKILPLNCIFLCILYRKYCIWKYMCSSSDSVECCTWLCFLRLPFCVKVLPHNVHVNGLIPSCIWTWSSRFHVLVNSLLQPSYRQKYDTLNLRCELSHCLTFSCLKGFKSCS